MIAKAAYSLLVIVAAGTLARAQEPQGVDWEAKQLTIELSRLGGPDIRQYLPDLYHAIRAGRSELDLGDGAEQKQRFLGAAPRTSLAVLLSNASVRREIEMLDDQYESFQEKYSEIQRELASAITALLTNRDQTVTAGEVRQKIEEIRKTARKEIEKAILPFQAKRLEQIAFHVQMRRRGALPVIASEPLASELKLTEEQEEQLREKASEIDQQLARDIAKLQRKARERLVSELRPDQKSKLHAIIGDDFDYEEPRNSRRSRSAAPASKTSENGKGGP